MIEPSLIVAIIQNIAFILSLGFLYGIVVRISKRKVIFAPIIYGMCFGLIASLQIIMPIYEIGSVDFSGHVIIIAMATIVVGVIPGLVAATLALVACILIHPITLTSIFIKFGAVAIGYGFTHFFLNRREAVSARHYLLLSVPISFLLVPWLWSVWTILPISQVIAVIVLTVATMAFLTVLTAFVLLQEMDHIENKATVMAYDQRLNDMIDRMPLPIAVLSMTNGSILYANALFARDQLTTPDLLRGKSGLHIFSNRTDLLKLGSLMLSQGQVENFEFQYVRPDGKTGWVVCSLQPIQYEKHAAVLTAYFDVTQRKHREQEFRTLVENSPDYILRVDKTMRCLYANAPASKTWGIKTDETGISLAEIPKATTLTTYLERHVPEIFESGEEVHLEMQFLIDQEKHFVEMRLVPEMGVDESVESVLCIGRDITTRHLIMEELRRSEEHYRNLFDTVNDAIVVFDIEDETVLDVNHAACTLYGYERDVFIGMSFESLTKHVAPGKEHLKRLRVSKELNNISTVHICKDGRELDILVNAALIAYQDRTAVISVNRDVTEIREAESALRESETLYRLLAENTSDIVSHNNPDDMVYISPSIQQVLGWTQDEMMQMRRSDFYHPDELEKIRQFNEILDDSDVPMNIEYRFRHKDGHYVWLEGRTQPVRDEAGNLTDVVTVSRDITERKKVEQEIADQQNLLETILSQSVDAIIVRSLSGEVLFANPAAIRLAGVDPRTSDLDVENLKWGWAYTPDGERVADDDRSLIRSLRGETVVNRELHLVREDGVEIDVLTNSAPLRNAADEIVGAVSNVVDITERKKRERESYYNQQLYQSLVAHIPNGAVFVFDRDFRYLIVEGRELANMGYDGKDFIGKTLYEAFDADIVRHYELVYKATFTGQESVFEMEFLEQIYEVHFTPIYGADGEISEGLGLFLNITDQKRAKEKVMQLALERARTRILTEFIGSVTHEFRTPLSSINANTYMLRRTADDAESVYKYVERIEEQSSNILSLVDSMVVMTRLDSDSVFHEQNVDLNGVLKSIESKLRSMLTERHIALSFDFAPDLPQFSGDQGYLRLALLHIMDNAVRYNRDHGKVLVNTRLSDDHENILITVEDTGIGIAEEHRERIFERFYRVDTARSIRGFGLGLPITKKIIESHQGTLHVESEPLSGTKIVIALPIEKMPIKI